ncbi:exodeoxyribonuclease III [Ahrensia sp. R2A130]|uniref:exodeoxyribonuclease III n=1 Tax=Ahrensia sp. R2A130 TaxID=744979 RepID=UPI0001E0E861|nr:exodeoxyribonuclease III [Ahrensia sp. R2A130]EFL90391.1 exodeoxyribonuclease III [Ahrensia sp. R2A130]
MKIASWNINGIKARHDVLIEWLKQAEPDIVGLQEIKSVDENFPASEIEALGYNVQTHGQKGFNGVALLSRLPFDEVNRGLPLLRESEDEDEQARFIEGVFSIEGKSLRVVSLYLPNGNPVDDPRKFDYKLRWMDRLHAWAADRLALEEPLILAGDYNVIPQPNDCWNPKVWEGDALFRDETRSRFEALKNLGFTEALRSSANADGIYTFWDYQAGAWPKNHGIRIDHLLMSAEAADMFNGCGIDSFVRDWEKPSDHVPIWLEAAA